MKKLITALGILLVSASAFANHTAGLEAHQAQGGYGVNINSSGGGIVTPKLGLYINQSSSNQPNIITDPVSCIEKWGDACLETDDGIETPQLDLGETNISEHLAPEPVIRTIPVEDGAAVEPEAGITSE
jgi:hypothetical protein